MLKSLACCLTLALASVAVVGLVAPTETLAAQPAEVSQGDGQAVRAVVEAQLKALAAGEGAQAFAYASPTIKSRVHDAQAFMAMVQKSYPMLIRPTSVSFLRPELAEGVVLQGVLFRDHDGRAWRAIYELERQPDKSWRINGCSVGADEAGMTT